MKIIEELKIKSAGLSYAQVEGLLHLLVNNPTQTTEELLKTTGLPLETLKNFRKNLSAFPISGLSPETLNPYTWRYWEKSNPDAESKLNEIRNFYGLTPKRELDQFFATPRTSIQKATILMEKGYGRSGMNVLLLGDDDLVSVALAILGAEANIFVADVDEGLLKIILDISIQYSFKNIKIFKYDVRSAPDKYVDFFDVIMTDPPYTQAGVELFVSRSLDFLKHSKDGELRHLFLFYGNSYKSAEKFLKVQEILNRYQLVIEDKINNFAVYDGAESIGSSSSLYITRPLSQKKFPNIVIPSGLYTFAKEKEEKFPFVDHVVFEISKVDRGLLKSKNQLLSILGKFCNDHKLRVVDTKVTSFEGQGMSITFILSNSNLIVHTWPEYNALHLDLVTCSPIYHKEYCAETLSRYFKTSKVIYRIIS